MLVLWSAKNALKQKKMCLYNTYMPLNRLRLPEENVFANHIYSRSSTMHRSLTRFT
jgi:hypothetical protein